MYGHFFIKSENDQRKESHKSVRALPNGHFSACTRFDQAFPELPAVVSLQTSMVPNGEETI